LRAFFVSSLGRVHYLLLLGFHLRAPYAIIRSCKMRVGEKGGGSSASIAKYLFFFFVCDKGVLSEVEQ